MTFHRPAPAAGTEPGEHVGVEKSKPAPLETEPGQQKDDNIDDLGRKQDGSRQEQPAKSKPSRG